MSSLEFIAILTAAVGAVASAAVSVLNRRQLKEVHEDTNGNLSALRAEVVSLQRRLDDAYLQLARPESAGVRSPDVGEER